ncbi:hypothetical protein [Nitrososphaera sp.]|uniref:hypothetical protein n=1 Tax=Nitrososphaera sp. TaxID=1971748 RepID=UPI00317599BC
MTNSNRNRVAGGLGIASAILFIVSGYSVNLGIYRAVESGIQHNASQEVWQVAAIPINILALVAQLGGFAVLAGALLFLKNHITGGKVLVIIGTGQGIITIIVALVIEMMQGGIVDAGNYVLWLATSATGIGIVFSIVARSIAKPVPKDVSQRK